mgnify:CR=1 FL=1
MQEIFGDFWQFNSDVYCVTTNLVLNKKGEAILGKGIAKQFRDKFPGIAQDLGYIIKNNKAKVAFIPQINWKWDKNVMAFPTKYDWKNFSDIKLIKESAQSLNKYSMDFPNYKFLITRPGCGNGGLNWEKQVKLAIKDILVSDNIFIIERK